jgi:hypothetical protein
MKVEIIVRCLSYVSVFVRGLNKEELELYTEMKVGWLPRA